jgi:hypothetical protein
MKTRIERSIMKTTYATDNSITCCPLAADPRKRAASTKLTSTIKDNFPPGLGQPALRALASAGYTRLDDLVSVDEADLLKLHGMGPKAVRIIRTALKKNKVRFLL